MITQEFLSGCTDEQINNGVAWIEIVRLSKMLPACSVNRGDISCGASTGLINTKYCTNPNDIMPIAFDNKFLIEPPNFFTDNWKVTSFYIIENIGERSIKATNTNPLRAICEVYILMNQVK